MDHNIQHSKQNMFGAGFPCPRCQNKITTTIDNIIGTGMITCSICNLQLQLNAKESVDSIEKLKTFNQKHPDVAKASVRTDSPKPIIHQTKISLPDFLQQQKLKCVYKDKSRLMRFFNRYFYLGKKDSDFMDYYATSWKDNVVYVPRKWWDKASEQEKIILLRHEIIHHKQMARYGFFFFFLLYFLIPFPIGFAYFRAKFEKEAYAETLRARYEYWGKDNITSSATKDWIIKQFTSSFYGWMWPFKGSITLWYEKTIQDIVEQNP